MNWAALFSLAVKYGPAVVSFIQKEGPAIQAFVKDVEAALNLPPLPTPVPPTTPHPGTFTS